MVGQAQGSDPLVLPHSHSHSGKAYPQVVQQMLRGWPTFIIQWTHLSLRTLCLLGVMPVMGKTENPFQWKPNLLKEKCVCPFNNLFVYYSTDRMMEQTISSQGTFLRHLSADNWSWNTSVWSARKRDGDAPTAIGWGRDGCLLTMLGKFSLLKGRKRGCQI